jgi:C-terminal processing protease CtpA/Prc
VPFSIEGDSVLVVGRGTAKARETALASARNDAIAEITDHILDALAGSPLLDLVRARDVKERRAETVEAEAHRYLQQVGAFATPERTEASFQEQGGAVTALARYRLRKEDFDAAVRAYRRTASLGGLVAAPVFPQLERNVRTKGDVIVVAVDDKGPAASAGVRVGDVVLGVNGRSVPGLDAFESAAQKPTDSGVIEVDLEAGGARRVVKLPRGARR